MQACDLTATEARRQIGIRALSPVELLDSCLGRIEQVNKQLNAIVAIDRERATEEALEAERAVTRGDVLGVLHGIPVAIKDLTDTAGLRTTYGSRLFAEHIPQQDEGVVADLRRAGAVVQMKTNTPEWGAAMMDQHFDPVVLRLIGLLKKALPECSEEDIFWGYHFVTGALMLTLARTGRIDKLSGDVCRSDDYAAVKERMATFMAAGFLAICQRRKDWPGSRPATA